MKSFFVTLNLTYDYYKREGKINEERICPMRTVTNTIRKRNRRKCSSNEKARQFPEKKTSTLTLPQRDRVKCDRNISFVRGAGLTLPVEIHTPR